MSSGLSFIQYLQDWGGRKAMAATSTRLIVEWWRRSASKPQRSPATDLPTAARSQLHRAENAAHNEKEILCRIAVQSAECSARYPQSFAEEPTHDGRQCIRGFDGVGATGGASRSTAASRVSTSGRRISTRCKLWSLIRPFPLNIVRVRLIVSIVNAR